jgi:hypothetical protein
MKEQVMKRVALIVAVFAVLAVFASPALAGHGYYHHGYGHHHGYHHHGYSNFGLYLGAPSTVVVPAPVYTYPAYSPTVVTYPSPTVVYPRPAYVVPRAYVAPGGYIGYRSRGLSIGLGF